MTLVLTLAAVHLLAVASPGPDFALVANRALVRGRLAALLVALGIALGVIVHVLLGAFGLSAVLAKSATAFAVVKWLGAAYLVYLGFQGLRSQPRSFNLDKPLHSDAAPAAAPGLVRMACKEIGIGFVTNAINPKAAIYFLAVFSQFGTSIGAAGYLGVGALFVAITFAWFALVACGLSAHVVRSRFERVAHWVDRACGAALIALGLRIAATER